MKKTTKKTIKQVGRVELVLLAAAGILYLSWLYPTQSGFVGFWIVNFFIKNALGDVLALLPVLLVSFSFFSVLKQKQIGRAHV